MIARYDIEQRTVEWHEVKHGKIGGTRAGVGLETLLVEIVSELTEEYQIKDDFFVSRAMQEGIDKEPDARQKFSAENFIDFLDCGWLQSEENDLLGISPDGISKDETIMCEIKCPEAKKYTKQLLSKDILKEYNDQLVHAFLVNPKLETHYFVMYRPENLYKNLWHKKLKKDSLLQIGTEKNPLYKSIAELVEIKRAEYYWLKCEITCVLEMLSS